MKNIVIAGSGPVGLYTAIRLKQKYGEHVNVIVIDSHISDYERPGIIAKMAVSTINESFKALRIPLLDVPDSKGYPPNSVFIGDLQKALVVHAQRLGVQCIERPFRGIKGNTVILNPEEEISIPCDLLIDCTGERRAVATYANESGDAFTIQTIAENPIKNHFIAYVRMNKEDSLNCQMQGLMHQKPLDFALNMEQLRQNFGWKEFALPEVVQSTWNIGDDEVRHCFYFEISESMFQDVTREEQEGYLKALLKLKTGHELDFESEKGRHAFLPFMVDPKIVRNPLNTTTYPFPVVLCGDSHMSPEYRFGTGVRNGIGCADALVNSVKLNKDELLVVRGEYEFGINRVVPNHESQVKEEYASKKRDLADADLVNAHKMYATAYDGAENATGAAIIANGLLDIADKLKLSADSKFREALVYRAKSPVQFQKIMKLAVEMYNEALSIYGKYCPETRLDQRWEQEAKILSNLSKAYNQLNDLDKALQFMSLAATVSIKHHVNDMVSKTQNSIREILVKRCTLDCKKLSPIKDASLIIEREHGLARELINFSQNAVDLKLTKECLKLALDIYNKSDSIDSLHNKTEIYGLLIKAEQSEAVQNTEVIESYQEALSLIEEELATRIQTVPSGNKPGSDETIDIHL